MAIPAALSLFGKRTVRCVSGRTKCENLNKGRVDWLSYCIIQRHRLECPRTIVVPVALSFH
jgi:hypothetical protein